LALINDYTPCKTAFTLELLRDEVNEEEKLTTRFAGEGGVRRVKLDIGDRFDLITFDFENYPISSSSSFSSEAGGKTSLIL